MEIVNYITDSVYGGIGFSENELAIIDTSTFQRLRRIKQQGITNLIFPSSDHTRFSHSIGVLHIMGRMTDHLVKIDVISPQQRILLRYAALLHDIGHYPLSHLTESVYRLQKKISDSPPDTYLTNPLLKFSGKPFSNHAHHERLGVEVLKNRDDIKNILAKDNIDPGELGEIITGTTPNQIYHQLMHSSFDADRLDYLLRDSSAIGVNYGLIDLDYLIRRLDVGWEQVSLKRKNNNNEEETEARQFLGIGLKGLHSLEHYLMARYFSYSQITMHRTSTAYECLAKTVIWELAKEKLIYPDYESIKAIVGQEEFLDFDDDYMWNKIRSFESRDNKEIFLLYRDTLTKRRKVVTLIEEKEIRLKTKAAYTPYTFFSRLSHLVKNDFSQIANALQLPIHSVGYTEQELSVDKSGEELLDDRNYREAARIAKNKKTKFLKDCSSCFIKDLVEKQLHILRIYYIDPFHYNPVKSNEFMCEARKRLFDIIPEWRDEDVVG